MDQPSQHAEPHVVWPLEQFLTRVAERTGLDRDGARRATEAVLETLGERISGGEVDDLASQLPAELHDPLRRGDAASHRAARPLSLEQFLHAIAEREGATPEEAHEHARAVFATLREAVTKKQLADISAQLPDDYAALMARP